MIDLLSVFARGGGGGSSGGGGGGGIIVLPIVIISMVVSWWIRRQKIKRARAAQKKALHTDKTWSDEVIQKRVSEVFYAFQQDWSTFNAANMKHYLTARYYGHIVLMLGALKQMNRRNDMHNVRLTSTTLFGVSDEADNEKDRFDVEIKASATDVLVDEATNRRLKTNGNAFEEVWHFDRENGHWMLDSISQVSRDGMVVDYTPNVDLKYLQFADKNGFYYNADFGWLLMPQHGLLFTEASYGRSDINHHVIGQYHNVIVQFFEYTPIISDKLKFRDYFRHIYKARSVFAKYTVAHARLPKDYSNILVVRRKAVSLLNMTPIGMQKISLEWQQFNRTFNVFAHDIDKVNSLELLNPSFMEKLASLPFQVNLEIVGSDLYMYTTDKKADYQQMLKILQEAFETMKM